MSERCGEFVLRQGVHWSCALPKGHEGKHRRVGEIQIPEPEPESRSIQRRKALQRGEPMPTFTDHSIETAEFHRGEPKVSVAFAYGELRAAIDEVERMPHVLPCSVYISCRYDVGAPSKCDCYKSKRLAILRARLAELEKKAEREIDGPSTHNRS